MAIKLKKCTKCGETKSEDYFDWKNKAKQRKHCWCKNCTRIKQRKHYQENKADYIEAARRCRAKQYSARQKLRDEIKSESPCADCGRYYPPWIMDFDHLPQYEKTANVSSGNVFWSTLSWITEIAKCDIVCSNCHRQRTHERKKIAGGPVLNRAS